MATARPLRDVFAELTGDADARAAGPAEVLRANGHTDLPEGLMAEAVVNYAETAPVEVAEHLAAFVTAHSSVPSIDVPGGGGPNDGWPGGGPDDDGPDDAAAGAEVDAAAWLDTLTTAPAGPFGIGLAVTDPTESLDDGLHHLSSTGPVHRAQPGPDDGAPNGGFLEFGLGLDGAQAIDPTDVRNEHIDEARYDAQAAPQESVSPEAVAPLDGYATPPFAGVADDGGVDHDGGMDHDGGAGDGPLSGEAGDDGQADGGFDEGGPA